MFCNLEQHRGPSTLTEYYHGSQGSSYHSPYQDHHNVDGDQTIPDPDLTPKGREQYKHLTTIFAHFDGIDLVCASPVRRAIQTASISMDPYLQSGKNKILALPLVQEAPAEPANTPSGIKRLEGEYGNIVNFERCYELSGYGSKSGIFAPDGKSLEERAATLRRLLRDREQDEIVCVTWPIPALRQPRCG